MKIEIRNHRNELIITTTSEDWMNVDYNILKKCSWGIFVSYIPECGKEYMPNSGLHFVIDEYNRDTYQWNIGCDEYFVTDYNIKKLLKFFAEDFGKQEQPEKKEITQKVIVKIESVEKGTEKAYLVNGKYFPKKLCYFTKKGLIVPLWLAKEMYLRNYELLYNIPEKAKVIYNQQPIEELRIGG